jgi:hypothetical protein
MELLPKYDFTIQYRRGVDNGAADALSLAPLLLRLSHALSLVCRHEVSLLRGGGETSAEQPQLLHELATPIRMQGYRGAVQAFVFESILEGFDVVLGDAWLRQHSVTLNYRARRMELRKGKRYLSRAPSDLTAQASGAKEHRLVSVAAIR